MTAKPPAPIEQAPVLLHVDMTPITAPKGALTTQTAPVAKLSRRELVWQVASRRMPFLMFWVAPTILYTLYIFLIAAPIYMSEAKFLVRAPSSPTPLAISANSSLAMTRSSDETQIVDAFLSSRDVLDQLAARVPLRDMYDRPEADLFSRLSLPFMEASVERLYRHFRRWATAEIDESTGITTVQAFAYRSEDARAIASGMIATSEALVNRLNARAYEDRVAYAQMILDKAQAEVKAVEDKLTAFRNATKTVDIGREASVALERIGRMSADLALLETSLSQQMEMTPNNPSLPSQKARVEAQKREIAALRREVVGSRTSMTGDLAQYERLTLERMMTARSLEAAIGNFDRVRQQSQVQQFYLARVSEPSLPETAEYPRRLLSFLIYLLASFLLWRAAVAALEFVRDHDA